jgi:hypothetical protein
VSSKCYSCKISHSPYANLHSEGYLIGKTIFLKICDSGSLWIDIHTVLEVTSLSILWQLDVLHFILLLIFGNQHQYLRKCYCNCFTYIRFIVCRVIQEELLPLMEHISDDILSKKCHITLGPIHNIYRVTFVFGNALLCTVRGLR